MTKYLWIAAILAAFVAGFVYERTPELHRPLDPQAAAMRDRIEWVKTYHGQDNVAPGKVIKPYKLAPSSTDAVEFTPATMPNHRCVWVTDHYKGAIFCTDTYGGLNNAGTN